MNTEHVIVLAYQPEGPFLCCCGLVLDDAERGIHHLVEESKTEKEAA